MLTGIGIIIILKQIPHFFGYNTNPEGDFAFFQMDGENTFSEIFKTINNISLGSTIVGFIGLGLLLLWSAVLSKKGKIFQLIQRYVYRFIGLQWKDKLLFKVKHIKSVNMILWNISILDLKVVE